MWVWFSQNNILSRMTWWSKFPQMFLVIEGMKLSVSIEVIVWISSPCWYIWLEGAVCAASKKLLLLFLTAVVRVSKMIQLVKLQRQDKPDFSPLKSPRLVFSLCTNQRWVKPCLRITNRRIPLLRYTARSSTMMKTVGQAGVWCQVRPWTHAAKSWMACSPPLEAWGQGAAGLLISLLDLWSTTWLLCTLAISSTRLVRDAYITGVICRPIDRRAVKHSVNHLLRFATLFLLSSCDPQQGCPDLTDSFFEASGDQAVS